MLSLMTSDSGSTSICEAAQPNTSLSVLVQPRTDSTGPAADAEAQSRWRQQRVAVGSSAAAERSHRGGGTRALGTADQPARPEHAQQPSTVARGAHHCRSQQPDQRRSKRRGGSELLALHRSAQTAWSSVVAGTLVRRIPVGLGADRRGLEMAVVERTQRMGHRFTEPLEPLNNRCFHNILLGLSSV